MRPRSGHVHVFDELPGEPPAAVRLIGDDPADAVAAVGLGE